MNQTWCCGPGCVICVQFSRRDRDRDQSVTSNPSTTDMVPQNIANKKNAQMRLRGQAQISSLLKIICPRPTIFST